jgi:hypothetical protein
VFDKFFGDETDTSSVVTSQWVPRRHQGGSQSFIYAACLAWIEAIEITWTGHPFDQGEHWRRGRGARYSRVERARRVLPPLRLPDRRRRWHQRGRKHSTLGSRSRKRPETHRRIRFSDALTRMPEVQFKDYYETLGVEPGQASGDQTTTTAWRKFHRRQRGEGRGGASRPSTGL